jgi:hypothetical protein
MDGFPKGRSRYDAVASISFKHGKLKAVMKYWGQPTNRREWNSPMLFMQC